MVPHPQHIYMQIADSLVFAATETESEFGGLFMQLNLP